MKLGRMLMAAVALGAMATASVGIAADPPSAEDTIVTAYTAPSVRSKYSFRVSGIVREVAVKDGDKVKDGQLLIQLDDRVERAQWQSLDLQARSDVQIEAAIKELEVAEVDLKRIEGMAAKGVAAEAEVLKARLNRDLAEKKIAIAKEEKAAKAFEAAARAATVDQMKITSRIDGEIEKVDTQPGELADYQKPSITVVKNDPLWVVINLPNEVAGKLNHGDVLEVRYDHSAPGAKPKFSETDGWQKGTVDFLSPAADASAFKRLVRLTMPNPSLKASGYKVAVRLPEKVVTAEAK